ARPRQDRIPSPRPVGGGRSRHPGRRRSQAGRCRRLGRGSRHRRIDRQDRPGRALQGQAQKRNEHRSPRGTRGRTPHRDWGRRRGRPRQARLADARRRRRGPGQGAHRRGHARGSGPRPRDGGHGPDGGRGAAAPVQLRSLQD
ncbi:MAG: Cytosol aminopeptidase PepA, partial [uncultured Microvirga sp.]